ncbi:MAG TPA: lamin tail domain-containing protein [Pyrinomonadaceae bacterium]|nr:lamin tail domain-containing protein [Pyrinomonadaceae bacterium]
MRSLASQVLVLFFLLLVGQQSTRAAELFIQGYTNGCFDCITPADNGAPQAAQLIGLTYFNSAFGGTTSNGGLLLTSAATAPATHNNNNLGSFQLNAQPASYGTHSFKLLVRFTSPEGIGSGHPVVLSGVVSGTITSTGTGSVVINFDNAPVALSYNDPNCEGDPATTCGSGQIFLRVDDLNLSPGQSRALAGRVTNVQPAAAGQVIISEFRMGGPAGTCDKFVELYNNTDATLSVLGYGVFFGNPNGSSAIGGPLNSAGTIQPRGHLLVTTGSYSLGSYASPNVTLGTCANVENAAVGLFSSSLSQANRVDSVTFSDVPQNSGVQFSFGEGAPLPQTGPSTAEHSWIRAFVNGRPQDTSNNAADFILISTTGGALGGVQARLGAPGPENLASPVERNGALIIAQLDPAQCSTCAPNRSRDTSVYTDTLTNPSTPATFNNGRLMIRRTYTNATGSPITRLRFRITDITTLNSPGYSLGGAQADLRAITSPDENINMTSGETVLVRGLRLEDPARGVERGGLNASLAADFVTTSAPATEGDDTAAFGAPSVSGDTINLAAPLQPGQSISVQFWLGVVQPGRFRFLVNFEALP